MKTRKVQTQKGNMRGLSLMLALSSALLSPLAASAADNSNVTLSAQSVQQNNIVKGTIVDELGEPMIGVTVKVKGSQTATITDLDGNFSLNVPVGSTLELTYIGYKAKEVKVSGKTLSLKMEPDNQTMDEVVVIGYGTQKKRDLTGAITTVKSDDITLTPGPNPVEALQGKVAGLDITRASGAAGASSSMKLRGTRSITASSDSPFSVNGVSGNDEPLVLVDGLPGSLTTLNANDIESIEVLKDAASTAVYGAAGANGIIIVTTKSGKEGKMAVNFNAYLGINGWSKTPKMHSAQQLFEMRKQALVSDGLYSSDENVYDEYIYEAYQKGQTVNWADELLKTGITQNYSVSISGGTEKTKGYMSLNYNGEDGQYSNDNYKVYSTNIKVDHQIKKWLSVGISMQGSYTYKNSAYAKLENALIMKPFGSAYDENGNVNVFPIAGDNSTVSLLTNNHSNYRNNNTSTRVYLNPYIRITPLKGLSLESRLSVSLNNGKTNKFEGIGSYYYYSNSSDNASLDTGDTSGETADGLTTNKRVYAQVTNTSNTNYKWENILTYNFKIGNAHDFTLTGVTSWSHNRYEMTYAKADNITSNAYLWHNLSAGKNQQTNSAYTMSKTLGFVGRVNYSYLGKYLASVSVRHDGSSVLAKNNRWDTFPAFSLGWRISDEKFMEGTRSWLDNLKLRFGWGVTGTSSISPYSSQANLTQSYRILGNETLLSYTYPVGIVDEGLGWEKSYNTNIGIDASFLHNRIDLSLDYYYTKTKDIIWTSLVPVTNGGYSSDTQYRTTTNICESKNNGLELSLTGRPFVAKKEGDFSWTVNLTYTKNNEELTKFSDGGQNQYINGNRILKEGEPIGSFYGYKLLGTWTTQEAADAAVFGAVPGDLKIATIGLTKVEDGKFTKGATDDEGNIIYYTKDNTYDATQDQQVLGHPSPDWTMGLKNTFTYKGFDLSIYLYWRYGQTIDYSMLGRYSTGASSNFPTYFDYATPETLDRSHTYPLMTTTKTFSTITGSRGVCYVDGSFFKVKNITLGYTLPKSVLKSIGIQSLRVYGTITNPLVFAKSSLLKDYDPEMAGNLDYPLTKQMVFGVNVSF